MTGGTHTGGGGGQDTCARAGTPGWDRRGCLDGDSRGDDGRNDTNDGIGGESLGADEAASTEMTATRTRMAAKGAVMAETGDGPNEDGEVRKGGTHGGGPG